MSAIQQGTILAHWIYTREEWALFKKLEERRKGYFRYIIFRLTGGYKRAPEITITQQKIWRNDVAECFDDDRKQLRRVRIDDAGKLNILEITYEGGARVMALQRIRIPIPKGRLREAIELQEGLEGGRKDGA